MCTITFVAFIILQSFFLTSFIYTVITGGQGGHNTSCKLVALHVCQGDRRLRDAQGQGQIWCICRPVTILMFLLYDILHQNVFR